MATKLDQSLDVIMKDNRKNRRRNPRRVAQTGKPAPVGGVQKTMKATKPEKVAIPTGPKNPHSKILVSNLVCSLYNISLIGTNCFASHWMSRRLTLRYVHCKCGDIFHVPRRSSPSIEFFFAGLGLSCGSSDVFARTHGRFAAQDHPHSSSVRLTNSDRPRSQVIQN